MEAKLRQSAESFPDYWDKVDYVRDHCKDAAWDIVKTRSMANSNNPYDTFEEMVQDLDNMFAEYDQTTKAEAKLHDKKFPMGTVKKDESFDEFLARFPATIAPLDFTERHKISELERWATSQLRWKVSDGVRPVSLNAFIIRLRQCDTDIRKHNNYNSINQASRQNEGPRRGNYTSNPSGGSKPRASNQQSSSQGSSYRHPPKVVEKLTKEGRCFKCLKKGHRSRDKNATCKNDPWLTKEQVAAKLASMGLDVDFAIMEAHEEQDGAGHHSHDHPNEDNDSQSENY